jgi:HEPN domain-containing protein
MEKFTQDYLTFQYPQWVCQPINLTLEEVDDPYEVIAAFFDCYKLHQSRLCLKRLLEDALNRENEQAINHLTFHDHMLKQVEAAWLVLQRQPAIKKVLDTNAGNNPTALLNLIVAAIKPERIFLLGTNPLDLLIVTPDNARRSLKDYGTIIEFSCLNDETVNASVIRSAELSKHLQEGHLFYSRVCQPANVLYEQEFTAPLPNPPKGLQNLTEASKHHFEVGFNRAEGFLKSATYHQEIGQNELAAFMLHQAVELAARALLLALTGKDIQTHDLSVLKKQCVRCNPHLKSYFLSESGSDERLLILLDKAYKSARYETDFKILFSDLCILKKNVTVLLTQLKASMIPQATA